MTRFQISALLVLALIAGCGGGGGSDGSGSSGGGNSGGGGSGPPNSNGTAEILFPWSASVALTRSVTVAGTASDPDGVASVLVNGVASTISASGSSFQSKTSASNTEVIWSARVLLSSGDNQLTVSVADQNNGTTEEVDTVTIKYLEVPVTFSLDPDNTRLVGLSNSLQSTGAPQYLVQHDYSTEEQVVFGELGVNPATTCFRRFEDEVWYLTGDGEDSYNLHRLALPDMQDDMIANVPATLLDGGAGYNRGSIRRLVCGETHTSAYFLINFHATSGDISWSRIVEVDLATAAFSVLTEADPEAFSPWFAAEVALDDEYIVALRDINPVASLMSVSLADGIRTELVPGLDVGGLALHPELASSIVYVATFEGIDKVDLIAGTRENISVVSPDDEFAFAQIRAIGYDAANNRVIVGDDFLDTVIAIDATSGERSYFISRRIGEGNALIVPRQLEISADATRAYVFDDGGNVAERLFEVDLTTGNRRTIGDVNQPFNYIAQGLAIDEVGRRAFIAFRHKVLQIDLDTELVSELATVDSTELESIRGLMFDAVEDRLLIGDSANDGIYALSLGSGLLQLVSRSGGKGEGDTFGVLVAIAESDVEGEVFAAGQASGKIFRVNLETGDRTAVSTTCNLGDSGKFESLMQLRYNEIANEMYILGGSSYSINFGTDECDFLPRGSLLLDLQGVSASQLLGLSFGALVQYDRQSGEVVVVSR